jgi:glucosamine 6-phosphate synthetase-like amidotransferase/phosphosugar isomerase protein
VENYKEIREKLDRSHVLESEKVELIDSEVVPHFFEESIKKEKRVDDALDALLSGLEGSNTISLLHANGKNVFLHLVHKGRTRGLVVWMNKKNEVIFCSRKEPVVDKLSNRIASGEFEERISIQYRENASLKLSIPVALK